MTAFALGLIPVETTGATENLLAWSTAIATRAAGTATSSEMDGGLFLLLGVGIWVLVAVTTTSRQHAHSPVSQPFC